MEVSGTMGFRMVDNDPIVPTRITHKSEQIWNGDDLEQNYNYLVYEFETDLHLYRARSYLDDIQTVSLFGPFDKNSSVLTPLEGVEIDQRILDYLRRRYLAITRLGPTGLYVPIK